MNILEHIRKAREEAIVNKIIANAILIDEDVARINGFNVGLKIDETGEIISVPDMIMGLKVEYAKLEPKLNANFLVYEKREEESKEKKLLNLLKYKRVDLDHIRSLAFYNNDIKQITKSYNSVLYRFYLTEEEMTSIVEWIKEK